jgi:hypothetical protein
MTKIVKIRYNTPEFTTNVLHSLNFVVNFRLQSNTHTKSSRAFATAAFCIYILGVVRGGLSYCLTVFKPYRTCAI